MENSAFPMSYWVLIKTNPKKSYWKMTPGSTSETVGKVKDTKVKSQYNMH